MIQIHIGKKVIYVYLFSGDALHTLGYFNKAIMIYDVAIKLNPNDSDIYKKKGLIFKLFIGIALY